MNALLEWLGEGGIPVSKEVAEKRASICRTCPSNVAPLWWERAKTKIAEAMRAMIAVKHDKNLEVSVEKDLHICKQCGCCLPTKVWVPSKHIFDHTSKSTLINYPRCCWIVAEYENDPS